MSRSWIEGRGTVGNDVDRAGRKIHYIVFEISALERFEQLSLTGSMVVMRVTVTKSEVDGASTASTRFQVAPSGFQRGSAGNI
jgi:hypothetical protein